MKSVEIYDSIETKKPKKKQRNLSPQEALIQTLEVMDFNAAISKSQPLKTKDDIDWIVLKNRYDQ